MKRFWERHQTLVIVTATALIALLMVYVNTWSRCREQFKLGEAYYAKADWMNAIVAYETAIHAYTPASSMVERSAERLWDISGRVEQAGDLEVALIAVRSLRSSFYAVRSLYMPGKEWIVKCDSRISLLTDKKREQSKVPSVQGDPGGQEQPPAANKPE